MTPIKRPLAAVGAAALLALSLTACGGSSAPSDASVEDFCKAVKAETGGEEIAKAAEAKDYDKVADLLKERVEGIEEVGTPEDIPDDAREGFEIQVDAASDISGDDIKKAYEDQGSDPFETDLSDDEKDKVKAYTEYESETCSGSDSGSSSSDESSDGAESGSDSSSESTDAPSLSTEMPSDFPTELPSNLPTDPSELQSFLESATANAG